MGFQAAVGVNQGFGIAGEIFSSSPTRAKPYTLTSANNTFGLAYTVASEGNATLGGTGAFAGILINPKARVVNGLAASLTAPQYTIGELCTMGEVIVNLTTSANIGDLVKYNNTTGALLAGVAAGGETQIANAKVVRYALAGAGLAVIELTN